MYNVHYTVMYNVHKPISISKSIFKVLKKANILNVLFLFYSTTAQCIFECLSGLGVLREWSNSSVMKLFIQVSFNFKHNFVN